MKKEFTFTVGIITCYGDDSILDTVKSIRASRGVGKFRFVIIADRNPIKPALKKEYSSNDILMNLKETSEYLKKYGLLMEQQAENEEELLR